MRTFDKIETPFNRDINGTKHLIENNFRSEAVKALRNTTWEWTEKVDGTNIRVHWDGHKVEFAGRTDKAQIPAHLLSYLETTFGGRINEELFEQSFGEKEVFLFGEGYGPKIQKGGNYRDDVSFILFDVMIDGIYLLREAVKNIAKSFGIDVVPIVIMGDLDDAINYVKKHPVSLIAASHNKTYYMEGLVGRTPCGLLDRRGNRVIVKVKWDDMKELI